jgi:hypothetical protein
MPGDVNTAVGGECGHAYARAPTRRHVRYSGGSAKHLVERTFHDSFNAQRTYEEKNEPGAVAVTFSVTVAAETTLAGQLNGD